MTTGLPQAITDKTQSKMVLIERQGGQGGPPSQFTNGKQGFDAAASTVVSTAVASTASDTLISSSTIATPSTLSSSLLSTSTISTSTFNLVSSPSSAAISTPTSTPTPTPTPAPSSSDSNITMVGIGLGIAAFCLALIFGIPVLMRKRKDRAIRNGQAATTEKSGIMGKFGRRLSRRRQGRGEYLSTLQPDASTRNLVGGHARNSSVTLGQGDRGSHEMQERDGDLERQVTAEQNGEHAATVASPLNDSAGIDRNTSVRSVMTLPAYSSIARPTEQVLGREGERAGIDIVLEHPETYDEEESRRDGEMESLYQIRAQRRQEQIEREERRRARRAARARGDTVELDRLQAESRRRQETGNASQQMIVDHQTATAGYRSRRISSAQYAGVGVARHDGSRVRADTLNNENNDESRSLLSPDGNSMRQSPALSQRPRQMSHSSTLSVSTMGSTDEYVMPTPGSSDHNRPSREDNSSDFEMISTPAGSTPSQRSRSHSPAYTRSNIATTVQAAASTTTLQQIPTNTSEMYRNLTLAIPAERPPVYDDDFTVTTATAREWGDAPPYESPAARTPMQALRAVPSIEVTGHSPVSPLASTVGSVRSMASATSAPVSAVERSNSRRSEL